MDKVTLEVPQFLADHLQLWANSGIPAPANELQSIQAWLSMLGHEGLVKTRQAMQQRMLLLMEAASAIHTAGPEAETHFGIYAKRSLEDLQNSKDVSDDNG